MPRASYAKFYLDHAAKSDSARNALLRDTGILLDQLSSPEYSVDLLQVRELIKNILETDANPLISIQMGKAFSVTHLGLMGHAVMSCDTLVDAVEYWNHFNDLVGNVLYYPITHAGKYYELEFAELCPLGTVLPFCIEQSLSSTLQVVEELTGSSARYAAIELTYRPEDSRLQQKHFKEHFGCRVKFQARRNIAYIPSSSFDRNIITADEETLRIFEGHCQRILQQHEDKGGLVQRIRKMFLRHPRTPPKLTDIAALMNISERHLRRKLSDEGVSYQQLLNDFRRDFATEYLKNTDLTAKEIAYLIGYDSIAAFRRAFKDQTGHTVKRYRELIRHG